MKISKKTKKAILNAIASAGMEALRRRHPDYDQWGAPDSWIQEQQMDFDLISEFENLAVQKVESIFRK